MGVPVHGHHVQAGDVEAVPARAEEVLVSRRVSGVGEVIVRRHHRSGAAVHVVVVAGDRVDGTRAGR